MDGPVKTYQALKNDTCTLTFLRMYVVIMSNTLVIVLKLHYRVTGSDDLCYAAIAYVAIHKHSL